MAVTVFLFRCDIFVPVFLVCYSLHLSFQFSLVSHCTSSKLSSFFLQLTSVRLVLVSTEYLLYWLRNNQTQLRFQFLRVILILFARVANKVRTLSSRYLPISLHITVFSIWISSHSFPCTLGTFYHFFLLICIVILQYHPSYD